MPKGGISLYFTMKDGASPVLTSIGDKTKSLSKENQTLTQQYKALEAANKPLIQQQSKLKTEMESARLKVKDATKAFRELGDEASQTKMTEAIEEQDRLKRELQDVESQIRSNQKAFASYREEVRKGVLQDGSSGSGTDSASLASQLGQAGLWSALGDIGTELGFALMGSAFGDVGSTLLSSTLSTASTGAAIGTMIVGPLGTAIGGALGAAVGAAMGAVELEQTKDEAFKAYYADLYDTAGTATDEMVESGSETAGSREQTKKAFAKRLGSKEAAEEYLARVEDFASETNYAYDDITSYAKSLMNVYSADEVFDVLSTLSDATAGLSLSDSDTSTLITMLGRMKTTGKASLEYLNAFTERGVDTYTALANAYGVDKSEVSDMVSKGQISGEDAAQILLDYMNEQYGGLSKDLMNTYVALSDNLEDTMTSIEAAGGDAYNELRKEGLNAEIDAYGGELGEALKEFSAIAGENRAYLENLSESYTRNALETVLLGAEVDRELYDEETAAKLEDLAAQYAEAEAAYEAGDREAGLRMEALKETTESVAAAAYDSSDAVQTKLDEELTELQMIRENTAGMVGALNDLRVTWEQSKGGGATIEYSPIVEAVGEAVGEDAGIAASAATSVGADAGQAAGVAFGTMVAGWIKDLLPDGSHAFGLDRVPYDGYVAELHRDERVLTAAEARAADARAGQDRQLVINVTGNNFTGTGPEMADLVAETIAQRLEEAAMIAVPA